MSWGHTAVLFCGVTAVAPVSCRLLPSAAIRRPRCLRLHPQCNGHKANARFHLEMTQSFPQHFKTKGWGGGAAPRGCGQRKLEAHRLPP